MSVVQKFTRARGVRFEYFEAGAPDLPVLVLQHGAGSSARIWRTVQGLLAEAGLPSIAVGTRGAGGSDHTPDLRDYAPENYARDLMAVLDGLRVERFTLVGHSLGTITAGYIARDHPDRLVSLVQIAGPHPSRDGTARPAAAGAGVAAGYRQSTGDAELAHWSAQHQGLDHETRAALRRDIDRNPEQRRGGQSAPWPGLAEVAANLEIPTLVVLGDADDVVSPTEPLRYYAELPVPRRHLHVLHGIGHYPNAQVPEALSALLAQFQRERCAAT